MKFTENPRRALKLTSAGFAYYLAELSKKMAEAEFISKAMKDCYPAAISPFTIWEARTVGQEAFFKSLKVKCRPIGVKPMPLLSCNTIDADKKKLSTRHHLQVGFIRADS